jgi:DNA polymerase (family X)
VAKVLLELADYSEIEDDQPYRARAYRRAAQVIEATPEPIEELWKEKRLQDLPGVGENIEKKIEEILKTGKLTTLEKIKTKLPVDVSSLTKIEGIGPKTVKLLYSQLKIKNIDDFEAAVEAGKLHDFRGLGVKSDTILLDRIRAARSQSNRILLAQAVSLSERIEKTLKEIPGVSRFAFAGSFRRMKDTIGDFDIILETEEPREAIQFFTKNEDEIKEVIAAGDTKASVKLQNNNFQVDVRVIPSKSWGAALLYFTGSKTHNIELRTIAIKKGYRLNEYGLYRADDDTILVAGVTEDAVYQALGMEYIEPEMRENRGEIEAASNHKLPKLVTDREVKGDLQMHTKYSDGRESIQAMAEKAISLGYEYIAITDHVGGLKIANAMDEARIGEQRKEIDRLNESYDKSHSSPFHIFQGVEVNIKADGRLDMPDSVLKNVEIVLASIHSGFSDDSEKITRRLTSAMENENVDIIAHPTGRLIFERTGYTFDLRKVIEVAGQTGTILEIDAHANRLDLNDEKAREVIKAGGKLSVDTDSHEPAEMDYMKLGIGQARRAWATKEDIINTMNRLELEKFLEIG